MDDVIESVRDIFGKLSEFLNIFDLSFFISGFTCFGALLFCLVYVENFSIPNIEGASRIIVVVIICYVLGLICFSLGRQFQQNYSSIRKYKEFDDKFISTIEAHGLRELEPYKSYLDRHTPRDRTTWKLYCMLWAGLRNDNTRSNCYSFLTRYWMMAATFDGLAVAIFVWTMVLTRLLFKTSRIEVIRYIYYIPLLIISYLIVKSCFREADRYQKYQMEEIISVYADKEYTKKSSKDRGISDDASE